MIASVLCVNGGGCKRGGGLKGQEREREKGTEGSGKGGKAEGTRGAMVSVRVH